MTIGGGSTDGGTTPTDSGTDTTASDESQQVLPGQLLSMIAPVLLLLALFAIIWMLIADRRYLLGSALLLLGPSPAVLANYLFERWQELDPGARADLLKALARLLLHNLCR